MYPMENQTSMIDVQLGKLHFGGDNSLEKMNKARKVYCQRYYMQVNLQCSRL